ncbi:MAG TPA: ATP-binding protein, partial [Limnobacter sp.]|nr:ATP-binding protein [Limnobacter sp.]
IFAGELSLSGALTKVRSPFALAVATRKKAAATGQPLKLMMPAGQAELAAAVPGVPVFGAENLFVAAAHLVGHGQPIPQQSAAPVPSGENPGLDMSDVIGHQTAKHALVVATAGLHHIRLVGPPGSGKSMLAQRTGSLLPPLPFEDSLEISAIRSLKGESNLLSPQRPFRNPHPSSSMAALIGGGNPPVPGEITLAHQGILFTDEVLEFDRRCLESLREPLETGRVNISRAGHQSSFPARFLWVCAHNPCPCGWLGHPARECRCTPEQVRKYQGKLSGPLADRLDISVEVQAIDHATLLQNDRQGAESAGSSELRNRVHAARELQLSRQGCLNGEMNAGQISRHCTLENGADQLLLGYARKHHLSARALHRICRVARTLADLENLRLIERKHVATAIQYRKTLNTGSGPL